MNMTKRLMPMVLEKWIEQARGDAPALLSFISEWHPRSGQKASDERRSDFLITASGAEAACTTIRHQIEKESGDPVEQFRKGLDTNDVDTLMSILNGAWFGVPE